MTALYIGGAAQGKLALAKMNHPDGVFMKNLHELVRETMEQGGDPAGLLAQARGKIVLCDEVGCGVVPLEKAQRDWREAVGRLCCEIAREAELVVRVTAGLPQVIKGELP